MTINNNKKNILHLTSYYVPSTSFSRNDRESEWFYGEEVFTAKEVVRQWNQQNAEATGKLYLLVEWSAKPEELERVDVVIGLIGNWISNPAFVQKCVNASKKLVLLFNDFQDPKNTIQSEYNAVVDFKHNMQNVCTCADYRDKASLSALLSEKLDVLQ